jgi:phospholipid/cholesterol/gamma-HCH transport system substrate-binding protein
MTRLENIRVEPTTARPAAQRSLAGVLVRLSVFAAVILVLLAVIVQAISRPVSGDSDAFTAIFTDVSGLKAGDDVRMYGVAVGKVARISITGDHAAVRFTVRRSHPLDRGSTVAIRYQSLTGQRYVDVARPATPGAPLPAGATIGLDHTVGSFDITALFNGLEPVLAELSPDSLNRFTDSMLAVIQGDGAGVGPALDAIGKLSDYVGDRQTVISTILRNLREIADQIGGRSGHLASLLAGLTDVLSALQEKVDGVIDLTTVGPSVLAPFNSLLETLGLTPRQNPDLEHDLRLLFPDPKAAVDLLGRLPGLLQAIDSLLPPAGPTPDLSLRCPKGPAQVPAYVDVLIAGQRIAVCAN